MTPSSIHSRRGQTLVEALIALSILTMGFVGIITLLSKSFQLNRTASDDTQATYLASEGIEIAKNIIDYDVYYGLSQAHTDDWECSFGLNSGQTADYEMDYSTVPPAGCSGLLPARTAVEAQSDDLYFNSSTRLYSYTSLGATKSDFTRDVRITMPAATFPNEIDVQSIVTWTNGDISNTITLEDHFYNWHP